MKDGRVNDLGEYTEKLPCAGIVLSELYAPAHFVLTALCGGHYH